MTGRSALCSLAPGDDADAVFDGCYPDWVRSRSKRYWTPVDVARRAAELLVTDDNTRVLDVGSGAGKFCIIGALTTGGIFSGIEKRPGLVEVARAAAKHFGARRTDFILGDITSIDWRAFNAFYLFNPFLEDADGLVGAIDYISFTRARLEAAPVGTRVATYHGYGGRMPAGFRCIWCEPKGSDFVEVWVKEPTRSRIPASSRAPANGRSVA